MLLTAHLLRLKSRSEDEMKSERRWKQLNIQELRWAIFELIDFMGHSLLRVPRLSTQTTMPLGGKGAACAELGRFLGVKGADLSSQRYGKMSFLTTLGYWKPRRTDSLRNITEGSSSSSTAFFFFATVIHLAFIRWALLLIHWLIAKRCSEFIVQSWIKIHWEQGLTSGKIHLKTEKEIVTKKQIKLMKNLNIF